VLFLLTDYFYLNKYTTLGEASANQQHPCTAEPKRSRLNGQLWRPFEAAPGAGAPGRGHWTAGNGNCLRDTVAVEVVRVLDARVANAASRVSARM
jgi:hypothetical protein